MLEERMVGKMIFWFISLGIYIDLHVYIYCSAMLYELSVGGQGDAVQATVSMGRELAHGAFRYFGSSL